jgi:hypothetical protein
MKKSAKKMTLHRETLRQLYTPGLREAVGGLTPTCGGTCWNTCGHTCATQCSLCCP